MLKIKTDKTIGRADRNETIREVYIKLMALPGAQSTAVIKLLQTYFDKPVSEPTIRRALKGLTKKNKSKKVS